MGLIGLCIASGCSSEGAGGPDNKTPIASTTLSGTIGGQAWTLVAGVTDGFESAGKPEFVATLYPETLTPCATQVTSVANRVLLNVPKMTGDYELGPTLHANFIIGASQNLIVRKGRLVVDEVTQFQIRGGAALEYDANSHVSGRFQISVCP
jgi:hypothetical protein